MKRYKTGALFKVHQRFFEHLICQMSIKHFTTDIKEIKPFPTYKRDIISRGEIFLFLGRQESLITRKHKIKDSYLLFLDTTNDKTCFIKKNYVDMWFITVN